MSFHHLSSILGENDVGSTEKRMLYNQPNSEEKNRIKNNDKSIAALEGKNLLLDKPNAEDEYSGKMWRYQKSKAEYQNKLRLRETYAKHLGVKITAQPDNSLGMYGNILVLKIIHKEF